MAELLMLVACALLANLALGLMRLVRGPSLMDRVAALQLFGTAGVGVLIVLAALEEDRSLRLAALLMSLLASAVTIALLSALGARDRSAEHGR